MEELARDILDEDFVEIFRWNKYLQYIMGFARADIRDRFVTPPNQYYLLYCFVLWVILVPLSTIYFTLTSTLKEQIVFKVTEMSSMPYFYGLVNAVCVVLYYENHFDKSDLNCKLFVKLQKIDRDLKDDFRMKNKKLTTLTKSIAMSIAAASIIWVSFMYYIFKIEGYYIFTIFVYISAPIYNAEAFMCQHILKYLCLRVEYIVQILKCVHKECKENEASIAPYLKMSDMFYGTEKQRVTVKIEERLVRGIHGVLSSMFDIEEVYKHSIFVAVFCFMIITHIGFLLTILTLKRDRPMIYLMTVLGVVYSIYLIGFFKGTYEGYNLSEQLKKTNHLCCEIISSYCVDEETERNANRMMILLDAKSHTISVYGLFEIDQFLTLKLFSIASTYTILYIQFTALGT